MRAANLTFDQDKLIIRTGIRVASTSSRSSLHLFAHPDRTLVLPCLDSLPPLVVTSENRDEPEVRFLALLSLITVNNGALFCATEEYNEHNKVLLFIDTCDIHAMRRKGRYLLPAHHDARLPHAQSAAVHGDADYGLAVCSVGESLFVQSTGGSLVNLSLGPDDQFSVRPCTEQERILMDADT